jgi:hypothetical protein
MPARASGNPAREPRTLYWSEVVLRSPPAILRAATNAHDQLFRLLRSRKSHALAIGIAGGGFQLMTRRRGPVAQEPVHQGA